jgi:hypothetical protein
VLLVEKPCVKGIIPNKSVSKNTPSSDEIQDSAFLGRKRRLNKFAEGSAN